MACSAFNRIALAAELKVNESKARTTQAAVQIIQAVMSVTRWPAQAAVEVAGLWLPVTGEPEGCAEGLDTAMKTAEESKQH